MPYRHQIKIPFQDIDAAGIVFFAHLFRYAHEAYEHFMAHIGHSLIDVLEKGDHLLPLVHAEADYREPLRLGQTVTIELETAKIGNSAFTLSYRFVADSGKTYATAETVHTVVEKTKQKSTPIPEPLRTSLKLYLNS